MSSIDKTKSEDLTLQAFKMIKNLLFSNEMNPKMRLNARELAKTLEMSPTPVTQALKLLHYQGIIRHIPNRGYFMEANTPAMVKDIFNLRLALETANVRALADRIDQGEWQSLERALELHKDALETHSPKRILLADMTFHITLARLSNGDAGERLMRTLFEMLYLKTRRSVLYTRPKKQFIDHHRQILDLLRAQKMDNAVAAISRHITQVRDAVLREMDRQEEDLNFDW